ncbi:MAG: radical SAM protein [Pseudomonadota bacterium]
MFVWSRDRSEFFRLSGLDAALFNVVAEVGPISAGELHAGPFQAANFECCDADVQTGLRRLASEGLLCTEESADAPLRGEDLVAARAKKALARYASERPVGDVSKPVWVHLQPFTFCNLSCIHCYCFSSPAASKFKLSIAEWRSIIAKLDSYGVAEVFITGGETLILDETWQLLEEIRARSMGTGLSTNGMHITAQTLERLRAYEITKIQVSVDGGQSSTHDYLRNKRGAFEKTIANLKVIAGVSEPVINTTVNKLNLSELDAIIRIGRDAGALKFKFFPQKPTGRAADLAEITLSDAEIQDVLIPRCAELAAYHGVTVETVSPDVRCGSARSGFSIDEVGDAYPCIFGIGDASQVAGNALCNDIDTIWFDSEVMRRFRALDTHPCRRCERIRG